MEENYLITIKGTMEQRGDTDTVELMTRGSLVHKDGADDIVYKETETTGYEGCTTTVKVTEDARKVSMSCGSASSRASSSSRRARAISAITRPATALSVWAWPPTSLSSGSTRTAAV